jgi:hypothetical protein
MTHRIRFKLVLEGDTVVDCGTRRGARESLVARIQEIVDREYADQQAGLDDDVNDGGLFYGLTLRLPGDIIVTGIDLGDLTFEDDLGPPEEGRGPKLRLITGGANL